MHQNPRGGLVKAQNTNFDSLFKLARGKTEEGRRLLVLEVSFSSHTSSFWTWLVAFESKLNAGSFKPYLAKFDPGLAEDWFQEGPNFHFSKNSQGRGIFDLEDWQFRPSNQVSHSSLESYCQDLSFASYLRKFEQVFSTHCPRKVCALLQPPLELFPSSLGLFLGFEPFTQ